MEDKKEKNRRVFVLEESLDEELRVASFQTRKTRSQIVSEALREFFDKKNE